MEQSKVTVRTSDRRVYRRCLRKWDFLASLRQNMHQKGTEKNIHFWFGSGIHFALEDYHGYNIYGDPRKAFYAYYHAFKSEELPMMAESYFGLGIAMIDYYLNWYPKHNDFTGFETLWLDKDYNVINEPELSSYGVPGTEDWRPAVEISFDIPLDIHVVVNEKTGQVIRQFEETYSSWGDISPFEKIEQIHYHGTIDRIVRDKLGRYWLLDYKTAKGADTNKLETDDQIAAYLWAATKIFPFPIYGFIYLQLTKDQPQKLRVLTNGEFSVDKRQKTTYYIAKQQLQEVYGNDLPSKYISFLNDLAALDTPEGDRFIRWDFVKRTPAQLESTERHIYGEVSMMLNPDLYCFPNPTRDCSWDCPIRDLCLDMDKGEDFAVAEFLKDWERMPRKENGDQEEYKKNLPTPEALADISIEQIMEDEAVLNIVLPDTDKSGEFYFLYEE